MAHSFSFSSSQPNIDVPVPSSSTQLTTSASQQQIEQIERTMSLVATNMVTSQQQNQKAIEGLIKIDENNIEVASKALVVGIQALGLGRENKQEVVQLREEVKLLKEQNELFKEKVTQLEYNSQDFKALLLGDDEVGKEFLYSLLGSSFKPTSEIDINILHLYREMGTSIKITNKFALWEIPDEVVQNKDVMYADADCAIVAVSGSYSIDAITAHILRIRKVCGYIPIVLLRNKVDQRELCKPFEYDIRYHDYSAEPDYDNPEPFRWLLRKLLRREELEFVRFPAFHSLALLVFDDEAAKKKHEKELNMPLPPDDDEDL